jgi:hypothetical protein
MGNDKPQITESQSQQSGARYRISAVVDGFPVELESTGNASQLKRLIERLKEIGATPPTQGKASAQMVDGVPVCPIHNKPMKPSAKDPKGFYCSKKLDNGAYCREKA